MTVHWHTDDSPPETEPSATDAPTSRRRTVLATLAVLAGLAVLLAGAVAFERQQRLAEARREVLGVIRVAEEAVASGDRELLASVVSDSASSLYAVRFLAGARAPVPGLAVLTATAAEPDVRFHAARPGRPMDRAEVLATSLVSDSMGLGQLIRRYDLAQEADGAWRMVPGPGAPDRQTWSGAVLTTEVTAADAALARPIHGRLDQALARLCQIATTAAEFWPPWQPCRFALTSSGTAPNEPERAAAVLPGPPGTWSTGDAAGEALLTRALAREMLQSLFSLVGPKPRQVTDMDEALIEAWLAPEGATSAPVNVDLDWAKLAEAVDGTRMDDEGPDAAAAALARRLASDIRAAGGRDAVAAVLASELPLPVRLNASLDPDALATVLAPWAHAPTAFPADRALLASCVAGAPGTRMAFVVRPGAREAVRAASLACPGLDAHSAAWRPVSARLTVACTDPYRGGSPAMLVDGVLSAPPGGMVSPTEWRGIATVFPAGLQWSPDGRWLGGRALHARPWLWPTHASDVLRDLGDAGYTGYPYQYDFAPPQWSPSARWLAFGQATHQDALTPDVVVVQSPDAPEAAWRVPGEAAAWSPIGDRLAVLRRDEDTLLLRVLEGESGREVTRRVLRLADVVPPGPDGRHRLTGSLDDIAALGWSPDGRWVAWRSHFAAETAMIAWRPDSGTLVTRTFPERAGGAWQPDGGVRVWPAMGERHLTAETAAPATAWDLASNSTSAAGPPATHWSPDGQWGAAGTGDGIVVTRAGATEPAWRSALRGCAVIGWQPDARAGTAAAWTKESEGQP